MQVWRVLFGVTGSLKAQNFLLDFYFMLLQMEEQFASGYLVA